MSRTDPQVNMRLPADLLQRMAAEATANKRSTTAEIVARLEASGMTLRDWFAGQALAGAIASTAHPDAQGPNTKEADEWAAISYALADAMIAERSK